MSKTSKVTAGRLRKLLENIPDDYEIKVVNDITVNKAGAPYVIEFYRVPIFFGAKHDGLKEIDLFSESITPEKRKALLKTIKVTK